MHPQSSSSQASSTSTATTPYSHYHNNNNNNPNNNNSHQQHYSKLSSGLRQLQQQNHHHHSSPLPISPSAPHSPSTTSPNSAINPKNLNHIACKFYRHGTCQAGNACPFSHSLDVVDHLTPCKYFQKGNCKFGMKCANAHITGDGRRLNHLLPSSASTQYHNHQYRMTRSMSSSSASAGLPSWHDTNRQQQPAMSSSSSHHQLHHQHHRSASSSYSRGLLPLSEVDQPVLRTQQRYRHSGQFNGSAISDEDDHGVIDDGDDEFGEEYVPSSLNELLTPRERQRRGSRTGSTPHGFPSSASSASIAAVPRPQVMTPQYDIWGTISNNPTGSPRSGNSYNGRPPMMMARSMPANGLHMGAGGSNGSGSGTPQHRMPNARDSYFAEFPASMSTTPPPSSSSQLQPIGTPDSKKGGGMLKYQYQNQHQHQHQHQHTRQSHPSWYRGHVGSTGNNNRVDNYPEDTQFFMEDTTAYYPPDPHQQQQQQQQQHQSNDEDDGMIDKMDNLMI